MTFDLNRNVAHELIMPWGTFSPILALVHFFEPVRCDIWTRAVMWPANLCSLICLFCATLTSNLLTLLHIFKQTAKKLTFMSNKILVITLFEFFYRKKHKNSQLMKTYLYKTSDYHMPQINQRCIMAETRLIVHVYANNVKQFSFQDHYFQYTHTNRLMTYE